MNEQMFLKALETIGALGHDAANAAIWLFGLRYGTDIVVTGIVCGAVLGVALIITKAVRASQGDTETLKSVRDMLKVGSPGYVSREEHVQILTRVAELTRKA